MNRFLKAGDAGNDAEDNAGGIGDGNRPVALLFQQTIGDPERAVNGGAQRLDGGAFMSGEIRLNLENIGSIHTNGGKGGDDGKDTDMFFVHGILQFVADFKNHSPGRMDGFIKTIRLMRQRLFDKSFAVA